MTTSSRLSVLSPPLRRDRFGTGHASLQAFEIDSSTQLEHHRPHSDLGRLAPTGARRNRRLLSPTEAVVLCMRHRIVYEIDQTGQAVLAIYIDH
jgi:hypothetical protein